VPLIERSVIIRRSVPEVFSYMDDIDREQEWQPNLRSATQEPRGPVGVGTVRRYTSKFLKKEVHNVYRVTAYEMYVRAVYESTPESDTHATAEIRWEQVPQGTKVTWTIDATPGRRLKLVPKKALEKASTQELERMLENLKARLEGD
jgi:carbon monoxide dehydrogenase subunit G